MGWHVFCMFELYHTMLKWFSCYLKLGIWMILTRLETPCFLVLEKYISGCLILTVLVIHVSCQTMSINCCMALVWIRETWEDGTTVCGPGIQVWQPYDWQMTSKVPSLLTDCLHSCYLVMVLLCVVCMLRFVTRWGGSGGIEAYP